MSKLRWADMTDDDPIPVYEVDPPVIVSKHGIRVKKSVSSASVKYVPPHRQDKSAPLVKDKTCVKCAASPSTNQAI
jgi:hypothetical protein